MTYSLLQIDSTQNIEQPGIFEMISSFTFILSAFRALVALKMATLFFVNYFPYISIVIHILYHLCDCYHGEIFIRLHHLGIYGIMKFRVAISTQFGFHNVTDTENLTLVSQPIQKTIDFVRYVSLSSSWEASHTYNDFDLSSVEFLHSFRSIIIYNT